jgi:hypothetical protein
MPQKEQEMPTPSTISLKKSAEGVTDIYRGNRKTGSITDDGTFSTVKTGGVQRVFNTPAQARRAVEQHFGQAPVRLRQSLAPAEILELEAQIARLAAISSRKNIAPPGYRPVTPDDIVEAGLKSIFGRNTNPELFDIAKRCIVIEVLRELDVDVPDIFEKPGKHNPLWREARQKTRIPRAAPEATSPGAIEMALREAFRNRDVEAAEVFPAIPDIPEPVQPQPEPAVTAQAQPNITEPPELAGILDLPAEPQVVITEAAPEPQRRIARKAISRAEADQTKQAIFEKRETMGAAAKRLGVGKAVISSICDGKYKAVRE